MEHDAFEALVDLLDGTGWVEVSENRFVIDISGGGESVSPDTLKVLNKAAKAANERHYARQEGDGTFTCKPKT